MNNRFLILIFVIALLLSAFPGCKQEKVPEPYRPKNAHDAYRHGLEQAGLIDSALGRDWMAAAEHALSTPVDVGTPYREIFYVDPTSAFAVGYRFEVERGQRIEVKVEVEGSPGGRLFIDLFRVREGDSANWVHVASSNQEESRLEFEPRQKSFYVARLQSELLRGGRYSVDIRRAASLDFPVEGRAARDIGSWFGDPRDGGKRTHHGVDIFARRHTPVLSPSRAYVQSVGEGGIGGLTVWLYDSQRQLYLYFAHLQTQKVKPYTYVDAGDVLGTVGNTGNARTTPPHLHFGIYARGSGPVDPFHFINPIKGTPDEVSAELDSLGHWVRAKENEVSIRTGPENRADQIASIPGETPMRVLAAVGDRFRVVLPDGMTGYVPAGAIELVDEPLVSLITDFPQFVMEAPQAEAVIMESMEKGNEYDVLGRFTGHWLVRTQSGSTGWIPVPISSSDGGRD